MKKLIQLNLMLSVDLKTCLLTTMFFTLLSFAHAFNLLSNSTLISVNLWDYLLISMGGVFVHGRFWMLFGWISTIAPMLFYIYYLVGATGDFDIFVLTRIGSRGRWWMAKFLTGICLVVLYSILYLFVHLIIGTIFFSVEPNWSSFSQLNYVQILQLRIQPALLISFVWLLFVTGIMAFSIFAQAITIVFKNSSTVFIILTIMLLVLGEAYFLGFLPRELSPIIYPSFVDLFQREQDFSIYKKTISYNIFFSLISAVVCMLLTRRYPFSSKKE